MEKKLREIASFFDLKAEVESIKQMGEGFINDTYVLITKSSSTPNYILQRKNSAIFTDVPSMMDNIVKVTNHIKKKLIAVGADPQREAMTVLFTLDGKPYYQSAQGEYWTMTLLIEDVFSYNSASSLEIAYAGGKGIGRFQSMLSDFEDRLVDILPGFHKMRFRFEQWDKAVKENLAGRVSSLKQEISWVESRREQMMEFWQQVESGRIPVRVTHNDTKINNILFDRENQPVCVIDLDTVLSSTILNDFGDAIRTYTNTGEEDDENLERVSMNIDLFRAFTEGYLSQASSFLSDIEIKYIPFSARFIVFEQVLRFLMDYINGDTYYKIKSPNHNLIRTHAQYRLLQSIESQYPQMVHIVNKSLLNS